MQLLKYIWHEIFSTRFGSIDEFSQQSNPKTAFPLLKCPKDWERVKDDNPSYLQPSFLNHSTFLKIILRHTCQFGDRVGRTALKTNSHVLKRKKNRFCKIIEVLKDTYIDTYFTHFVELKPTERRFLSCTLLRKI